MARRGKPIGTDERLQAFAQRLNRAMLAKGWTGAELAREASKFAPKGVELGRLCAEEFVENHLVGFPVPEDHDKPGHPPSARQADLHRPETYPIG